MTSTSWHRHTYDLRADHPRPRPATSTTASGCCRRTSAPRSARSTRWPGASTTSATAICRAAEKVWPRCAEVRRLARRPWTPATDPVLVAVADAARRFPIPLARFDELIDGVQMDVTGRATTTFDDLVRLLPVRGRLGRPAVPRRVRLRDPTRVPRPYADALGIALQQTNILRDVREDLLNGRIYLPRDDLDRFGVRPGRRRGGGRAGRPGRRAGRAASRFSAARARAWYADGLRLMPLLDRRSAACTPAMAGIYRQLLDRIAARPAAGVRRRLSLSGAQKAAWSRPAR